jgi:HD-GYP domain-containing protein (c-di-GMP phosphodiesterase class II)
MPLIQGSPPSGGVIGMANRLARDVRTLADDRENLQAQVTANRSGVEAMLCGLLDTFNPHLGGHGRRVARLVDLLAVRFKVSYPAHQALRHAALFHDIGMLGMQRAVLFTPWSELSETDRGLILSHPEIGASHLRGVPWYEASAAAVAAHHEHWDGSGFPARLAGEDIPIGARILSVCDTYDEMLNKPADAPAQFSEPEVLEHLRQHRGHKFDPRVVDMFLGIVEEASPHEEERRRPDGEIPLSLSELREGHRLARDLLNVAGLVLLTKGTLLAESNVLRLRALRGMNAVVEPVYVHESAPQG